MRHLHAVLAVAIAVSTLGALGCKGGPTDRPIRTSPIESGIGSVEQARKFLQGRWSLLSFDVYPPGQPPIAVKGSGTLLYDDYGNLDMEILTTEDTGDRLAKVGIVMQNGILSSKGRTILDMQNKRLTYEIEGQAQLGVFAGPLATNRPRYWEVEGDVLTLTTKDADGKAISVGKWRKQP